mmetsp:Transcript_20378/g.23626  ORF Transcript_20378/g.23626 Transcript_20378/m.23626 type:complete len:444 (+) Transcript_20378:96-1427(+)
MSYQIIEPVNQVRLTNVAVVRMSRHGKRFEVACYRNKILNYRQKIETDLSEVLQTDRVFTNVSKGLFAPSKDLLKAFDSTDQEAICRIILDKGQIQVSDMERSATLENTAREVANMVATKCVHPLSNRPYTVHQIRDAMKQAEFSVQPTSSRSVKRQFLDCVRAIQEKNVLDIERAKMELAIVFPLEGGENTQEQISKQLKDEAHALIQNVVDNKRIYFLVDPSKYRIADSISKKHGGTLEISRQTVTQEGDVDVSLELERNNLLQQSRNDKTLETNAQDTNRNLTDELGNNLSKLAIHDEGSIRDEEEDNEEEEFVSMASARKKNKKAMKKSKKAKRREKEEISQRQERIDVEKARQEERNFRLGVKNSDGAAQTMNSSNKNEDSKSCNTCGGSFTASQYRAHFRSDWHRYNVKLKMKGCVPVEEKEFLMIDADAFFADTLS